MTRNTNPDEIELPAVRLPSKPVEGQRDRAAAYLLGEDLGEPVLDNIRRQASTPTRNAQWANLYAEIVGWKGTMAQVLAMIVRQLGCSFEEAEGHVRLSREAPNDPHEIAAECRKYLAWYDETYADGE